MCTRIALMVGLALAGCVGNQESETQQASTGPVSLAVTPATAKLPVEALQQLTATGTYADGTKKTLTTMVAWASSAPSVASVNAAGQVQALAVGTATISATADSGVVASSAITVSTATLRSVAPNPATASIVAGYTKQLVAQGTWSDGTKHNVANATWASNAPGIASVDATGLVSGRAAGNATITVSHAGAMSGAGAITVTPAILKSIAVTPAAPTYPLGVHPLLTATGTFSDGSTQDLTAQVAWTSSAPAIAQVDGSGALATLTTGATTITATSGTIKGTDSIHVSKAVLASIQIASPDAQLPAGTQMTLKAFGTFSDSSGFDVSSQVAWSSANTSIATISPSGVVSAVAPGLATLTATDPGTGVSASVPFQVDYATLLYIAILPGDATYDLGEQPTLQAWGHYSDGTNHELSQLVDWSSSVPSVAAVSDAPGSKGLTDLTALGVTTIGVVDPVTGASATTSLHVKPVAQLTLAITPGALKIPLGYADKLQALTTYDNGTGANDTANVAWASDAPSIASVAADGTVTSHAIGTAHVTATGPQPGFATTITVTVAPAVFAQPTGYATGGAPSLVKSADVDEDGKPDIVTCDYFDGVHIFFGNGDGTLRDGGESFAGSNSAGMDVGDLDGDGHVDIATANYTQSTITLLYGRGDGSFESATTYFGSAAGNAGNVIIGDVDGDGHQDLVFFVPPAEVMIAYGHGDRTFDAAVDVTLDLVSVFDAPRDAALIDIDGDGLRDLVVADQNSLRVLTHTAPRAFAQTYVPHQGVVPKYVAVGRLSATGPLGVFASNNSDDKVSVWTVESGALLERGNIQVGDGPVQLALADFDGDGVLDVAVGSQTNNNGVTSDVCVALGHGDGTFAAPYTFLVGTASTGMAAVDLDGDGRPDLASVDAYTDMLYVVPNRL